MLKLGIAKYDFSAVTPSGHEVDIKRGDHMEIIGAYEDNGYWFLDEFGTDMAPTPWPAYEARLINGIKISAIHEDAIEIIE